MTAECQRKAAGALMAVTGTALVVIGWVYAIYAGVPGSATEWLKFLELHGIALTLVVIGVKLWRESRGDS